MSFLALAVTALFVGLGALHFYWAFGGRAGLDKAIPRIDGEPAIEPGRALTLLVGVALLAIAGVASFLGAAGLRSNPYGTYIVHAGWFLAGVFALRAVGDFRLVGFFKRVRSSEFARYDSRYYSPLCVALSLAFAALSFGQR